MRLRVLSLLVVFMLACQVAFAGTEAPREAADERCLGIWVSGCIAVEIWRENEAIRCRAVFSDGSDESAIWEYAVCVYQEASDTLQCFGVTRTRERFDYLLDSIEELEWSMDDLSLAELRLSDDSLLFTDDGLGAPVALTRLNEAECSQRNEALAFAGLWTGKSSTLRAEDHGACFQFTVTALVDNDISQRWTYTCLYDPDSGRMASVNVSPRTVSTREANGGATEVQKDFAAGEAEFILDAGNRLIWKDMAGDTETVFERLMD